MFDMFPIFFRYSVCSHSDFVHGLTWFGSDCLYTCGWDALVVKHKLTDIKNNKKTTTQTMQTQTSLSVVMEVNGKDNNDDEKSS